MVRPLLALPLWSMLVFFRPRSAKGRPGVQITVHVRRCQLKWRLLTPPQAKLTLSNQAGFRGRGLAECAFERPTELV